MRRLSKLIVLLLTLSILASAVMLTAAEVGESEEWQADIRKLMDEAYAPKTTETRFDHVVEELTGLAGYAGSLDGADNTAIGNGSGKSLELAVFEEL